jgi:hypothetical protein
MKLRTALPLMATVLLAVAPSSGAEKKTATTNAQRFEALKKLAGDWVEVGADGKATDKVISSIRVTSGGTAVQEMLFPGSGHEMVTMYYLNGADLMLTHYCRLGNQPRMRAEPGEDAHRLAFKFVDGTNLKSTAEHHMHEATLTIADADHFKAEWASCKDGKTCHQVSFNLVRKPR